jgi:TatA/E family protein of Tat protein translocase
MFNIGPQELLFILVLALLVVGPKRLPELGRSLGRGIRELRKAQDEVRKTIQINLDDEPGERPRRSTRPLPVDDPEPTSSEESEAAVSGGDLAASAATADATAPSHDGSDGVAEISRTLGRSLAELRRAREEIQRSFRVDAEPLTPARRPVVRSSAGESDPTPAPEATDASKASDDDPSSTPG